MFHIKTRARWLVHGAKTRVMLLSLLPLTALAGAALSFFLTAMTSLYGAHTVFGTYALAGLLAAHPVLEKAVPYLFFCAGAVFTLCFCAARFTLLAAFYYRTDRNQTRPHCFLSFKTGAKALYCAARLSLCRTGWLLLLLSPALLTAGTLFLLLRYHGLTPVLFYAGAGLAAGQTAAAAGAYFVISGRYCLTRYLMYLNPLLPVREAIRNSVLLTRGKRGLAAACRLNMLPWYFLCLFSFTRPFAFAYTRLTHAVLCETVYAEDKTKVGKPAAVFLINRATRMEEK